MKNTDKINVFLFAFICMAWTAGSGSAKEWPDIFKKIQAKYEKFDDDIKDMTIVQDINAVVPSGEVKSRMKLYRKGKKFRVEIEVQIPDMPEEEEGVKTVFINDGKDTWMISSILGRKKISTEEFMKIQTNSNWWEMVSEKAKISGTKMVNKRKCYVVEFEAENKFPFTRLWLDKEKLVLIKGESRLTESQALNWIHSDFRKIKDDWEFPYITRVYADGELVSTSVIELLRINGGLSDDLFDPDKVHVTDFNMQNLMEMIMPKEDEE